jgi:hypothetical protein
VRELKLRYLATLRRDYLAALPSVSVTPFALFLVSLEISRLSATLHRASIINKRDKD